MSMRTRFPKAYGGRGLVSAVRSRRHMRARQRPKRVYQRQVGNKRRYAKYLANMRTGGFLGIEYKFLDTAWNGVALVASTDGAGGELQPSSGSSGTLSVPAQGDGESNRDGRKYTLKSAWVSGQIIYTVLAAQTNFDENYGAYFCLVLDTQANGATINSEDVFVNPGTSGINILPTPMRNLQNSKRFKILAAQYVPPPPLQTGNDAATTFAVCPSTTSDINLSWKGSISCDSIGTTANITSASDNAIHLVAFSGTTTYTPTFYGKGRCRFVG